MNAVDEVTPVEQHGKIWLKRDDRFEVAGVRGGKARACLHLAMGATGLITAGARHSPQMQLVSRIAAHLDLPCRCHTAAGPATAEMLDVKAHGGELVLHRPGYNNVIISRAKADAEAHPEWTYIPFGMESYEAMQFTREQVCNIPVGARRIVIAVGSGMSAAGVLWGLRDLALNIPVLGVRVGADPAKQLNEFGPPYWQSQMKVVTSALAYKTAVNASIDGVRLDPIYEAKCAEFLEPGDLLWIVGIRAGL